MVFGVGVPMRGVSLEAAAAFPFCGSLIAPSTSQEEKQEFRGGLP